MKKILIALVAVMSLAFFNASTSEAESWQYTHQLADGAKAYIDLDSAWYKDYEQQGGALFKFVAKDGTYSTATQDFDYHNWQITIRDTKNYDVNGKLISEDKNYKQVIPCPENSEGYDYMVAFREYFGY